METLIVLTVFSICTASVPLLYDGIYEAIESGKAEENIEWEIFVIQLRNELHASKNWWVSGTSVHYIPDHDENSIISINKYENVLRRQINGRGHEVMLQDVKNTVFSLEGGKFYIHVTFTNGEKENAAIYSLSPENN